MLAHLAHSGEVWVRDIEARVDMEKSKVSRAASRLEAAGYIAKKVGTTATGGWCALSLTDAGRGLMRRLGRWRTTTSAGVSRTCLGDRARYRSTRRSQRPERGRRIDPPAPLLALVGELPGADRARPRSARWDSAPVDLTAGEQRGEAHRALNPQGLVPVLEIDGLVLTQSLAIVEYLDETRGAGFLPGDAAGRARVRALAYAIAMEIHPVCNLRVARHAVEASGGGDHHGGLDAGLHRPRPRRRRGDARRRHRPFATARRSALADICLAPQLYNADRWGVALDAMPRIRAIRAELDALPAVAAAHPDRHAPG